MDKKALQKVILTKPSGIDWIGDIPSEWNVVPMKELFRDRKILVGRDFEKYTLLRLSKEGVFPKQESDSGKNPAVYDAYQVFEKDDLVFCTFDYDVTPRTIGHVRQGGMLTGAYTRLIPKEAVVSRYYYYYYYALDIRKDLLHLCTGLRNALSSHVFWNLPTTKPPKETQEKIVVFLDEKTAVVDAVIARKKRLIGLLKEKRSSIITHAVTKGLDPNTPTKASGIDWIGDIPSEWGIYPGFYLIRETRKKNLGLVEKNLLSLSYGNIIRKADQNSGLTPASFEPYQIVIPGQIVFRLTDLQNDKKSLRSGLVKEKGIITSAYTAIKVTGEMSPGFLSYLYRSYDHVKVFYTLGAGVRQSSDFSELKKVPLLLPPKETQEKIVAFLDEKTKQIDDMVATIERQIGLLNEYRASLIYHCVTGKISI